MAQNMLIKPISSQVLLSFNIKNIDSLFPGFMLGDFAIIYGLPSVSTLSSLLAVRAPLPYQLGGLESSVAFIDGGNTFRLYKVSRLARLHNLNPSARARNTSKDPKNYKQMASQVIAAKQLIKEGAEVAAGKNVKFLFISAENKRYERRVTAEELIEKNTNSDVKKYLLLLYASAVSMFSPFGYSAAPSMTRSEGTNRLD